MTNILSKLNSPEVAALLIVVIPLVLKLAALVRLDATKLPPWAQPLPALVLSALGSLLVQLQTGTTLVDSVLVLLVAWAGAGGAYHIAKRWVPKGKPSGRGRRSMLTA